MKFEDVCSGLGELPTNKTIASNNKLCCMDLSIRIHACNAIRYTSVILSGSFVTLSQLGPRQQYVAHLLPRRALWPQVQSVILPLYFSLRFGIRVGHESLLHLDLDLASSIRYTSVILFTVRWDPRGPRITLSS